MNLRDQTALVTGGGARVGSAIARALGAAGMRVAIHHHASAEGARETADAVRAAGGHATTHRADLRDPSACASLVGEVAALGHGLHLLVASAGAYEAVGLDAIEPSHVRRAFELDTEAPLWLARAAAPLLRAGSGSIVVITDAAISRPTRGYLPYLLSKGALRTLVRALAVELAPGVRVNAVAPGTVLPPVDLGPADIARLAARTALGRIGRPEDVAGAVVYLARAGFVTGQEIVVDGGSSLSP